MPTLKDPTSSLFLNRIQEALSPLQEGKAFFEYQHQLTRASQWGEKLFALNHEVLQILEQIESIQERLNRLKEY